MNSSATACVLTWVAVSWYLAATALFFAAMLQVNTEERLDALMRGCLIAGIIAAVAGVAGYFRLVPGGSDLLLLYDRARGTFKDPNVFGAFLVLPALIALQRIVARQQRAGGPQRRCCSPCSRPRSCCRSRARPGASWPSPACSSCS